MQQYWCNFVTYEAPLVLILCTSMRKANISGYGLEIQNIFVLYNRGVKIENILLFNSKCNLL